MPSAGDYAKALKAMTPDAAAARNLQAKGGEPGVWGPTFAVADEGERGKFGQWRDALLGLGSAQGWKQYQEPDRASVIANLLGAITPIGLATKLTKPLTEAQFMNNYYRHIDIRGRGGNQEANLSKIMEEGFKPGFPNAIPMGGSLAEKYPVMEGDFVYLVPKKFIESSGNGPKIKSGWKPEPNEVIRVSDPSRSLYEQFLGK